MRKEPSESVRVNASGTMRTIITGGNYNWHPGNWTFFIGSMHYYLTAQYTLAEEPFLPLTEKNQWDAEIESFGFNFGGEYQFENQFLIGLMGGISLYPNYSESSRHHEYKKYGYGVKPAEMSLGILYIGYNFIPSR